MIYSIINWLWSRGISQQLTTTSSDARAEANNTLLVSTEMQAAAGQTRRTSGEPLTQAARLRRQWALEVGLPTAEYDIRCHDLAASLPGLHGGETQENDR